MPDQDPERHDPFHDNLQRDLAQFHPRGAGEGKPRPDAAALDALAAARGFTDRRPGRRPAKEPTKPLQFRLPVSEVEAFKQAAYQEFGLNHGAQTALFRLLWQAYQDAKTSARTETG